MLKSNLLIIILSMQGLVQQFYTVQCNDSSSLESVVPAQCIGVPLDCDLPSPVSSNQMSITDIVGSLSGPGGGVTTPTVS